MDPRCTHKDSFKVCTMFSQDFYECVSCGFVFGESEVIRP